MSIFQKAAGALFLLVAIIPNLIQAQEIKVTLLGTGCPPPVMNRFGPSILVEAGEQKFLFDAGRGALQRLTQLRVPWEDVDGIFFTHLHSDHVVGFPDLWLTGWIVPPGRHRPLTVWGPRGTQAMMENLEKAFQFDIRTRRDDAQAPPEGVAIRVQEVGDEYVLKQGGVSVTAFEVDHRPVKPAFGYRIDYAGHSVVLSGDTRPSANLIRHAQGVDVLIHEVVAPGVFDREGMPPERTKRIIAYHTTPEDAGTIFAKTNPRLAVYSHIVPPGATEHDLIARTRTTYAGPLEVGEDLTVIIIGEKIELRRFPPSPR